MNEYRVKLGADGRILIPGPCRKLLHLEAGEDLIVKIEDNELHLLSLKQSLKKAQSLVKRYAKNKNLVEKLIALRQEDRSND